MFTIIRGKLPRDKRLISSRWGLRPKFTRTSNIGRRKARVVVRDFKQEAQLNYFDTFTLVLRYTTLRVLLSKVVVDDLKADRIDINNVFVNSELKEEVYIEVPQYFKLAYPKLKA